MNFENHIIISDLSTKIYFSRTTSLFRHYQDMFLDKFGCLIAGRVVELGGELHYNHKRFFKHASAYVCSNIRRDHELFLDMTDMEFEDNSQDAYICISVLEHVFELKKAIAEIERTLKPGGKLLITVPFAYPYHDEVDYWRLSVDTYYRLLSNFEIKSFVHLGGLFSSIADNLKRPKEKWNARYTVYKIFGFLALQLGKILERKDGFPLGYGIYAEKKIV